MFWKERCIYEAQTSHQAKEWRSVVSELTHHLNRVKPPLMTEALQDGSTTLLNCQEDAAQDQVLSEARSHHEVSTGAGTTGGCSSQRLLGHPEVFYQQVPAESLHPPSDDDIYEEIQTPEVHTSSTSLRSSEFHCYEDLSDGQHAPPVHSRTTLPAFILRLPERCALPRQELTLHICSPPVAPVRHSCDTKVQQLIKVARDSTKDGLEKTKSAMIRKVTFLKKKDCTGEVKDDWGYVDVCVWDLKHPAPQLSPMPEGLSAQQVVRRLILTSIVQSENSYLDSLHRILQQYQKPLLEPQKPILNPQKVHQIFHRVQEIYQCHSMFQIALASRIAEWDFTEKIGDLFVASFSTSMVLNVYSDYINNFTNAMTLIKKACMTKPAFLDFLKRKQVSSPDRITLYGLMVKPVQRFPQFILLLQDMLKNTPKTHKDRLPLQLALTELEILAEKLNEQKRLADQETEIQQLLNSMGDRNLSKLLHSDQRQLVHCELLTEVIYGDKGQVIKSKQRKLFLFNNTLMCATVNWKGSPDITSLVPVGPMGPRYTVKWCSSLLQTQVVEVGQDNLQSERPMRTVTCHSSTSNKAGKVYLDNPSLYQELEELQHDLAIVEEVTLLVSTLIGTYQNLNTAVSQDWTQALNRLIRLKEEQIQKANRCHLRLYVPAKPDKSGRPVNVMVVFNTPSPLSKISWMNRLHMAKTATRHENSPGWEGAEDEGRPMAPLSVPLLTCKVPVFCSGSHSLKMEAALHSPSQSSPLGFCTATTSLPQGYLWVAGGGGASPEGQIEIWSLNRATPRLVKTLPLRAPVLCLEYVKESCPSTEDQDRDTTKPPTAATMGNLICVGLEDGSIHVFSSVDTAVHCQLVLTNHDISPVVSLKHSQSFLFAGLANGRVAIYRRNPGETLWDSSSCELVCVGSEPVCTLLTLHDTVWAGWTNQVTLIHGCSLLTERFEAHPDPACRVSHMVRSGGGVWMAFTQGSSIHLFHTETLEQLQEVNICTRSAHVTPGQMCVSSLLICQGLLWVGTTQGIILTFPIPTLEGIPKVKGKGMVSLNAHSGPVDFLVAASNTLVSDMFRGQSICNSSEDSGCEGGGRTDVGGTVVGQSLDQEFRAVEHKPKGVLLQYRLRSTQQLPGKLLTSQADQADQDALMANPVEDGSIYEVNEDPDVWVRGRPVDRGKEGEARRSRITSIAIFSGGRGYRRVEQDAAVEPENTNTLLVWQLCLTLSQ